MSPSPAHGREQLHSLKEINSPLYIQDSHWFFPIKFLLDFTSLKFPISFSYITIHESDLCQYSERDRPGQPDSQGSTSGWHVFLYSPWREFGSGSHLSSIHCVRSFVSKKKVTGGMKLAIHCYLVATEEWAQGRPYTLKSLHGVVLNEACFYFRNVNNISLPDTDSPIKVATNNCTRIMVAAEFKTSASKAHYRVFKTWLWNKHVTFCVFRNNVNRQCIRTIADTPSPTDYTSCTLC